MTTLVRVVLSALHLEDDDLLAAAVTDDLAGHAGAAEHRNAGLHVLAVVAEQDFVEFDLATRLTDERWELIRTAGFDTVLLAAGLDDRVRHWSDEKRVSAMEPKKLRHVGASVNQWDGRGPQGRPKATRRFWSASRNRVLLRDVPSG